MASCLGGVPAALKIVTLVVLVSLAAGCGGSAFVEGTDAGPGDASTGAGDGAAVDSMVAVDSPPDEGLLEVPIACGEGASAPTCTRTCCVSKTNGDYDFACKDGVVCGADSDTGLRCNDSNDCKSGNVCCITKVGSAFASACATSCAAPSAQLCNPLADTSCHVTQPCSTNDIESWGLPDTYGTCGGLSPP